MQDADAQLVEKDDADALENRIRQGMDINATDMYSKTLLHCAVWEGSVKCLKVLVQHGVDVTKENRWMWTSLHFAAIRGHIECAKILVEAKANVDVKNNVANTPLHIAACKGHKACVQILLAARAQVDTVNHDGRTVLANAISNIRHECAELLLHAGAKLSCVSVPIPEWMSEIVTKYDNFKAAYTVLYGVLRRRVYVSHLFDPGYTNPSPVMLLICFALLDTRLDSCWNIKRKKQ